MHVMYEVLMQERHAESWDIISRLHVDANVVDAHKVSYAQKEFHRMVKSHRVAKG